MRRTPACRAPAPSGWPRRSGWPSAATAASRSSGGDGVVDQAPLEGGGRVDEVAGEQHLQGALRPDRRATAAPSGSSRTGRCARRGWRSGRRWSAIARSQTATSWQPAAVATPCTWAITGWSIDCTVVISVVHIPNSARPPRRCRGEQLAEVVAGGEGGTGAGDDDDPPGCRPQRAVSSSISSSGEGVAPVGAVERDPGDEVVLVHEEVVPGDHGVDGTAVPGARCGGTVRRPSAQAVARISPCSTANQASSCAAHVRQASRQRRRARRGWRGRARRPGRARRRGRIRSAHSPPHQAAPRASAKHQAVAEDAHGLEAGRPGPVAQVAAGVGLGVVALGDRAVERRASGRGGGRAGNQVMAR